MLRRPRITAKFPSLTEDLVSQFIERLTELAVIPDEIPATICFDRDPKDEPYLNLAIAGKVEYLVSRDHDLLSLAEHSQLRQQVMAHHTNLRIIDPITFLRLLRGRV